MSYTPGILCVSIDSSDTNSLSIEAAQRRKSLMQLIERYDVPANWTVAELGTIELPENAEVSVKVPRQLNRTEMLRYVRLASASLLRVNSGLTSVVLDPHEAREHWDIFVRQGCSVTRPRTAGVTSDITPRIARGGLWVVPLTCQFVGGSPRSVRSLFGVCQRYLVDTVRQGGLFHLNVDIGNDRASWTEEMRAIETLMKVSQDQRAKGRLRCATLSELPAILTKKPSKPMHSILRRAA